jgi:hypothetical protein
MARELHVGETYFTLIYADDRRTLPIVETFVYIGRDQRDPDGAVEHMFQFARSYHQDGDWNQMTMSTRSEYTEPPVISFDAREIDNVVDVSGLIEALTPLRHRRRSDAS